jgi:Protein of unknown function (DUF2384)
VEKLSLEAVAVINAAARISDDPVKAIEWYRTEPLSVFDSKTAEQLVSEGRAQDVLQYIASLEAGAAG